MEEKMILIADDAEINREMLKFIFEEQFQILEARDGQEAIELIDEHQEELAMIFLDLVMPKKTGLDVLHHMTAKGHIHRIPVIMITGEATADSDVTAYEFGASDIIYKPFEPRVVMRRTLNLMELFERRKDMEKELDDRMNQLRASQAKLEKSNEFLINALSSVVEFRNLESGEHIKRIKKFTKILLDYVRKFYPEYGLDEEKVALITNAAALHDLGMIAISDDIIRRIGKLSRTDELELENHTVYGAKLLEHFHQEDDEFYQYCHDICKYHHERYDGSGYPEKLSGDEIPIWSQVVGIADAYETLVSSRAYREAYDIHEAVRVIQSGECGQFSPKILDCFDLAKEELFALSAQEDLKV